MTAFPARSSRSAALLLFLGAGAAGFGLGLLALALTEPARVVAAIPPPQTTAPRVAAVTNLAAPEAETAWAPLFGVPAPAPIAPEPDIEPEPEPEFEPPPIFDDPLVEIEDYRLQGLVVEGDSGWALIESDEGVSVYRVGDFLPGGEQLVAITQNGVEVEIEDVYFFIGFDEPGGFDGPGADDDFDPGIDGEDESDYYENYEYDETNEADMNVITLPPRTPQAPQGAYIDRGPIRGPVGTGPMNR